jgi:hypothetical protein
MFSLIALHFKLTVEPVSSSTTNVGGNTTSAKDYSEGEFTYSPQIDQSRDQALLEVLPDYLAEDIEFSREHASRFYQRITNALTAK